MRMGIMCPLSMASAKVKFCHLNCKFLCDGKCLLAEYLEKKTQRAK